MTQVRRLSWFWMLALSAWMAAATTAGLHYDRAAGEGKPEAESQIAPTPDRLARPTLPPQPSQADLGSQVYYYVCMACHGDQGQGLTPEWLDAWGLGEESCWQSKCHASNHPPEGFKLPQAIPPVVGSFITLRFASALEVYQYLKDRMPWQAPGSLEDEEYWQLTAFLLRWNGIDPGAASLSAENAARVSWRPVPSKTASPELTATPHAQPSATGSLSAASLLLLSLVVVGGILWGMRKKVSAQEE